MRILFISNNYPPYEIGGYEQLCRDVVERMLIRGHDVRVLTTDHGVNPRAQIDPAYVHRTLQAHIRHPDRMPIALQFLLRRPRASAQDLALLWTHVAEYRPDVVFIWNLQGLPRSLAVEAESIPGSSVAYWLAGYSPREADEYWLYWNNPGRSTGAKVFKALFGRMARAYLVRRGHPIRLQMHHVAVVSEYMRKKGIADRTLPPHSQVIYNGVELDQFSTKARQETEVVRLLLAGRLSEDKGAHTALEALRLLIGMGTSSGIHLTIIGKGPPAYRQQLESYSKTHQLESFVEFRDWVARNDMPNVMATFDVLLLPSIHPEPFARIVLEAMASGLAVVATPVGGTGEIVEHNLSGLLFKPTNATDLAAQIQRLLTEPGLRQRLAAEGYRRVWATFGMDQMIDKLETLLSVAAAERGQP